MKRLTQSDFNKEVERWKNGLLPNYDQYPLDADVLDVALSLLIVPGSENLEKKDYMENKKDIEGKDFYFDRKKEGKTHVTPMQKLEVIRELYSSDLLRKASLLVGGYDLNTFNSIKELIVKSNKKEAA